MWNRKKKQRAIHAIVAYGKPHRYLLARGVLATVGVVFFRLAMPWPLRGVVEAVFPKGGGRLLTDYLPAWGEPVLWMCAAYFILAVGLGISEMIQRVAIMRFASFTAHDMRTAAAKGAMSVPARERAASGDVITRIVGDSARLKAGLSGIMVHGLQNGLLFLAVCGILLYISVQLGLIFLAAGIVAVYIGLGASAPVAKTASKQRRKEGTYAAVLQEGLDYGGMELQLEGIDATSTKKEVRTTRIIALSSLYVHAVLAAAVGFGLWYGAYGVKAGLITPGELFLFIAYALTVHRRMVQVGRQAARTGKVMASADRIAAFIHEGTVAAPVAGAAVPLTSGLRLEQVRLNSGRGHGARARLRRTDLEIRPGTRVAVLGGVGAGKSSLLKLLAGVETPDKGRILWDGKDVTDEEETLSSSVAYLPQDPVFPPAHLWRVLGLAGPGALNPGQEKTLKRIGALKLVKSFPAGLEDKVGSTGVSRAEARLLRLAGILLADTPRVWVLDNPVQGLRLSKARKCIEEIIDRASDRSVVIALTEPVELGRFDRVLLLRNGKIDFDGTPSGWEGHKHIKRQPM